MKKAACGMKKMAKGGKAKMPCAVDKDKDMMACGGKVKKAKGGGISQAALKGMGRNMAKAKAKC